MRKKIAPFVEFQGITVRVDRFLELWADHAGRKLKELPFKRDLRFWNDGPTAMRPKKTLACYQVTNHEGEVCLAVFEIWERSDGFSTEVFKFDDLVDYENYNPSGESPLAIKKEIGLL